MINEEQMLKARLNDLADKSYKQNIYTYTAFLTTAEQGILNGMKEELLFASYETNGGFWFSERRMARFGSEERLGYAEKWPISIVLVEPVMDKFADELSHRDFLGSLMNLGIERNVIGDILVKDGKRAYICCQDKMSGFIADNLSKIKHTNVKCAVIDGGQDLSELSPVFTDMECIVQNPRFDAVVAAAVKCSRNEALKLFKAGKVTLNGIMCEKNSITLKENDIFSVRGHGKFIFCGNGSGTRKGRVYVHLKRYE